MITNVLLKIAAGVGGRSKGCPNPGADHFLNSRPYYRRLGSFLLLLVLHVAVASSSTDVALAQNHQLRRWEDASGKFSVEASMVSKTNTKVTLLTVDGKRINVPVAKLSDADRNYLSSMEGTGDRDTHSKQSAESKGELQKTRSAIEDRLLGPAVEAQKTAVDDLQKLLGIPVYVDRRSLEEVGIDWEQSVELRANHATLRDQLNAALAEEYLSFYRTQTVLVICEGSRRRAHQELRFYRIRTPRNDSTPVIRKIVDTETSSWRDFGGDGEVVPIGNLYAIWQSQAIHRQLARDLGCDPEPRQFDHELDSVRVSISSSNGTNSKVLSLLDKQLAQTIVVSGIEAEKEAGRMHIPLELDNVSARDVLDLVSRQMYCSWVEEDNQITLKLAKEVEKELGRQKFSFKVLNQSVGRQICNTIETCIVQGSWKSFGGKGSVRSVRNGFLVEQSEPVMRQVEQFFADLHRLK